MIGEGYRLIDGAEQAALPVGDQLYPPDGRRQAPEEAYRKGLRLALAVARRAIIQPHAIQFAILMHQGASDKAVGRGRVHREAELQNARKRLLEPNAQILDRPGIDPAAIVFRDDDCDADVLGEQRCFLSRDRGARRRGLCRVLSRSPRLPRPAQHHDRRRPRRRDRSCHAQSVGLPRGAARVALANR